MNKLYPLVLGLMVCCLILILPVSVFQTREIQVTVAITVLMVLWWTTEAIPIPITSLVPLIIFPLCGVMTLDSATSSFSDRIIFLFLGGFIIASSMERWNLHRRIALAIILRTGNSPRMIVLGFMIATAFISIWISNSATAMMMIPIALSIIGIMELKRSSDPDDNQDGAEFAKALVISIAYAATIGGFGSIIGSPPNGIFIAQMKTLFPGAPPISFLDWMAFGIPLVLIFLPITWLWLIYGPFRNLPRRLSHSHEALTEEREKLGPISPGERWTLIVFVMTALMWLFSVTKTIGTISIPGIDSIFPGIDDSTIALFGALLLFLLPVDIKKGEFTMNWKTAVKIPWGILLLFGGGICLSKAFISSGLTELLAKLITSLNILDVFSIILLVVIAVSFLSEITSNTAIATVMMPVMAATSLSLSVNPVILMLSACLAASIGFILPVATPPNAIAYGTGYITMKDMMKAGFVMDLAGIVIIVLIMYTLVLWVLGISTTLPPWAVKG